MSNQYIIGLNQSKLETITYEDFIKLISNINLIEEANKLMMEIGHPKMGRHFLSAFLIRCFPNETFEFENDVKKELIVQTDIITNNYYNNDLNQLKKNMNVYLECFKKWKIQDNLGLQNLLRDTITNIINSKKGLLGDENKKLIDMEKEIIKHYDNQIEELNKKIEFLIKKKQKNN
tara:strand:+ start:65 stop:592 length:528 start_codon:yes stop_codon:yes gene_type:complete